MEGGWCETALRSEDGDWLEPGFWGRRALPSISLTYVRRTDKASPWERIGLPVLPPMSGPRKSPAEGGQSTEKKGRRGAAGGPAGTPRVIKLLVELHLVTVSAP